MRSCRLAPALVAALLTATAVRSVTVADFESTLAGVVEGAAGDVRIPTCTLADLLAPAEPSGDFVLAGADSGLVPAEGLGALVLSTAEGPGGTAAQVRWRLTLAVDEPSRLRLRHGFATEETTDGADWHAVLVDGAALACGSAATEVAVEYRARLARLRSARGRDSRPRAARGD